MEQKQIDPKMQRAHEALLKDGWGLLTKDYYEKELQDPNYLIFTAIGEFWVLYHVKVPVPANPIEVRTPLARFEHLPAAAEAMTWEGKER